MPVVRGGYGFNFFGTGDYGVEGTTKLASSTVSAAITLSGSVERVRLVEATASGVASASTTIARVRLSDALASPTSSTSSAAEKFVLKESDKASYGTGAYGQNVYDNADLQTIASATASLASINVVRIRPGDGSTSATASTSSSAIRVPEGVATVSATTTTSASAQFSVSSGGTGSALSTNTTTIERVRLLGGALSSTSSFAAIARKKWEPISADSQNWDTIGTTSITWSNVA